MLLWSLFKFWSLLIYLNEFLLSQNCEVCFRGNACLAEMPVMHDIHLHLHRHSTYRPLLGIRCCNAVMLREPGCSWVCIRISKVWIFLRRQLLKPSLSLLGHGSKILFVYNLHVILTNWFIFHLEGSAGFQELIFFLVDGFLVFLIWALKHVESICHLIFGSEVFGIYRLQLYQACLRVNGELFASRCLRLGLDDVDVRQVAVQRASLLTTLFLIWSFPCSRALPIFIRSVKHNILALFSLASPKWDDRNRTFTFLGSYMTHYIYTANLFWIIHEILIGILILHWIVLAG